MDRLCWCFVSAAPPKPTLPVTQKRKDDKAQVRELMIATLRKDRIATDKFADLDDLIKNRNDDNDVDVDELIHNAQASLEQLDGLIETVKSMVARNGKVMKRCEEFHYGPPGDFTFQRVVIDTVQVLSSNEIEGKSLITFKTTPRQEIKNFGIPPLIPTELTGIIVVQSGFAELPDYDLFLERSLLLNNDVLKPFLQIFRGHLEKIQSFYNDIDSWIREPRSDRHFLEQMFGIDFEISTAQHEHEEEDNVTQSTTVEHSDTSSRSSDDGESYSNEVEYGQDYAVSMEDKPEMDDVVPAINGNSTDSLADSVAKSNVVEDSDDEQPKVLEEKVNLVPYNKVKRAIPDKEIIMKQIVADGNYSLFFNVDQDGQKGKLEKFLEFLTN